MSEQISLPIVTKLKPAELKAMLEAELGEQREGIQLNAERQPSEHRGIDWHQVLSVLPDVAKVAALISSLIGLLRKNKVKKVRLIAEDDSKMEVPHDLSPALYEEFLKKNPQFRELKEIVVE